jgi:hypothetical protein
MSILMSRIHSVILYHWMIYTRPGIDETLQPSVGYCCCEAVWLCSSRFGEKSVLQLPRPLGTRSGTSRTGCALPSSALQMLIDAVESGSVSRDELQEYHPKCSRNRGKHCSIWLEARSQSAVMSSQVLHVEEWTVGFCTPGRPDSLELS